MTWIECPFKDLRKGDVIETSYEGRVNEAVVLSVKPSGYSGKELVAETYGFLENGLK